MDSRQIVEEYLNFYNRKDISSMINLFSEDMQYESKSTTGGITQATSRQQYRELSRMNAEYFEERQQTAIHWVISENSVAIETEYWCRLAKDLPNGAKTGEGLRLRGASFFTIENGLIIRLSEYL